MLSLSKLMLSLSKLFLSIAFLIVAAGIIAFVLAPDSSDARIQPIDSNTLSSIVCPSLNVKMTPARWKVDLLQGNVLKVTGQEEYTTGMTMWLPFDKCAILTVKTEQ